MTKDELSTLSDICEKIAIENSRVENLEICLSAISRRAESRQYLTVTVGIGDANYMVSLHKQHINDAIEKSQDLSVEIAEELKLSLNQAPATNPQ